MCMIAFFVRDVQPSFRQTLHCPHITGAWRHAHTHQGNVHEGIWWHKSMHWIAFRARNPMCMIAFFVRDVQPSFRQTLHCPHITGAWRHAHTHQGNVHEGIWWHKSMHWIAFRARNPMCMIAFFVRDVQPSFRQTLHCPHITGAWRHAHTHQGNVHEGIWWHKSMHWIAFRARNPMCMIAFFVRDVQPSFRQTLHCPHTPTQKFLPPSDSMD